MRKGGFNIKWGLVALATLAVVGLAIWVAARYIFAGSSGAAEVVDGVDGLLRRVG